MNVKPSSNSTAKQNFFMFATTILMWMSIYSYQSNFTPYMSSLGLSSTFIGLVTGSYGFTQMMLRIPCGIVSDKLKTRKLFIVIGISFTFISAIIFIFSKNPALILIARACAGISASTWVNFIVLFSSYRKNEEAVGAVSMLNFYGSIGQLFGMILGSALVQYFLSSETGSDINKGYKSAFILAFVIGIAAFIFSFFLYEDRDKLKSSGKPVTLKDLFTVMTDKTLVTVSLIAAVSQFISFGTIFSFTPKYASEVLNSTAIQNGLLVVIPYLPSAFGSLILGKFLIKRFKEYNLVFTGLMLLAVFTMVTPLVKNYYLLLVTQTLAGIEKGISFPLLMGLSIKNISPDNRGAAMGFFQAVYGAGMFIGPLFVGIISDALNLSFSFILLGCICLATALAALFTLKKILA